MAVRRDPVMPCPHCQAPNNANMHPSGSFPADGELALCCHCGGLGIFVRSPFGMVVRKATETEAASILRSHPELAEIIALSREHSDPLEVARRRTVSNGD